eukprot:6458116-Amphidinium_carterae.1
MAFHSLLNLDARKIVQRVVHAIGFRCGSLPQMDVENGGEHVTCSKWDSPVKQLAQLRSTGTLESNVMALCAEISKV